MAYILPSLVILVLVLAILLLRKRADGDSLLSNPSIDFKQIIDQSIDVIYIYDAQGYIIYVSPSVEKLLGFTPAERIGKRFDNVSTSPGFMPEAALLMRRALSGEIDQAFFTIEHITKDGLIVWTEQHARIIKDGKGEVVAINVIMRDITERKKAEEELKKSKELYKSASEYAGDVIYIYNTAGKMTYVSPSIEQVFGFTPAERIGKSLKESGLTEESQREADVLFSRALKGEFDEVVFEMKHVTKAGGFVWTEINGRVVKNESNKIEAIHMVVRDITERRTVAQALKRSEQRYRELAERSLDPIISYDEEGLITYASPIAEKVWGLPVSELMGRHYHFAMAESSRKAADASFERLKTGISAIENLDLEHILADGSSLWSEVRSWPSFDSEGLFTGFQFVARDVTDKKKYLSELEVQREKLASRTEQLMSLNQQLDSFSSTVSHDLKGPLRRISKYLKVIDSSVMRENLGIEEVEKEIAEMSELVDYLLNLSSASGRSIQRENVDLVMELNRIAARLRFQTGRNFEMRVSGQDSLNVYADPTLLRMLLGNLVENSFKYAPSNRELVLSIESISNQSGTTFSFSDNGDGFGMLEPGQMLAFNSRGQEYAEFPGHGIGLATVNQIVSRHDGQIWVGNTETGGACIKFNLGMPESK